MKVKEKMVSMIIGIAGFFAIGGFIAGQQIGYQQYGHNAVVAEVTNAIPKGCTKNAPCVVEFMDSTGTRWVYENSDSDIEVGEIYILTLKDVKGTREIFDDKITNIKYQSNVAITAERK